MKQSLKTFSMTHTTLADLYSSVDAINPLTPNDHYSGRTAPLASKRFILYIY